MEQKDVYEAIPDDTARQEFLIDLSNCVDADMRDYDADFLEDMVKKSTFTPKQRNYIDVVYIRYAKYLKRW